MRNFSPDKTRLYANLPSTQSISALNSETLEVLWTSETGVSLIGPPTPDPLDRYIVAPTHRPGSPGNLFAFASTGQLLWREDFGAENGGMIIPGGPVFTADGNTFYTGSMIPGQDVNNEYSYVYAFSTVAGPARISPIPIGAVSRKVHGSAGTFDVELPLTGTPGVESRSGGANGAHQVIVSFASHISASGATVSNGSGNISSYTVTDRRRS
jgi:hypothetical protein